MSRLDSQAAHRRLQAAGSHTSIIPLLPGTQLANVYDAAIFCSSCTSKHKLKMDLMVTYTVASYHGPVPRGLLLEIAQRVTSIVQSLSVQHSTLKNHNHVDFQAAECFSSPDLLRMHQRRVGGVQVGRKFLLQPKARSVSCRLCKACVAAANSSSMPPTALPHAAFSEVILSVADAASQVPLCNAEQAFTGCMDSMCLSKVMLEYEDLHR